MKITFKKVTRPVIVCASIVLAIFAGAKISLAQDSQRSDLILEEISVTGSYIKRKNQADLPSPMSIVGMEEFGALGVTDVSRVLETFTFNQGGIGGFGDGNGLGKYQSSRPRAIVDVSASKWQSYREPKHGR